jgi:hypothetical protein
MSISDWGAEKFRRFAHAAGKNTLEMMTAK